MNRLIASLFIFVYSLLIVSPAAISVESFEEIFALSESKSSEEAKEECSENFFEAHLAKKFVAEKKSRVTSNFVSVKPEPLNDSKQSYTFYAPQKRSHHTPLYLQHAALLL